MQAFYKTDYHLVSYSYSYANQFSVCNTLLTTFYFYFWGEGVVSLTR